MTRKRDKARKRMEMEVEDDSRSLSVDLEEVEEEEKVVTSLYACFQRGTRGAIQWFRIDPMESKPFTSPIDPQGKHWLNVSLDDDQLKPVCTWDKDSDFPDFFAVCSWKSKIFTFGGCTKTAIHEYEYDDEDPADGASSSIFVCDTSRSDSMSWESAPVGLLQNRCRPGAVLVNDKIYIFSSSLMLVPNYTPNPWAEIYDLQTHTSAPLPEIPALIKESGDIHSFAVIDGGLKIVFLGDTDPYTYHTITHKWGRLATPLGDLPQWNLRTAVHDQVLYTFSDHQLLAYDLRRDQWFPKPVQGLDILSRSCQPATRPEPGYVFNLGKNGEMCLFWTYFIAHPPRTTVSWLRFSIISIFDQQSGDTLLSADVKSYATYCLPFSYFMDCVPL